MVLRAPSGRALCGRVGEPESTAPIDSLDPSGNAMGPYDLFCNESDSGPLLASNVQVTELEPERDFRGCAVAPPSWGRL